MGEVKVTSIEDLREYNKGSIVTLPPFSGTQPFVARIRRPSLLKLVRNQVIPNKLMDAALELFYPDENENKEKNMSKQEKLDEMEKSEEILRIVAKESLVSPTYDEIIECGMDLTYPQLVEIYNFTQTGINDLYPFRTDKKD